MIGSQLVLCHRKYWSKLLGLQIAGNCIFCSSCHPLFVFLLLLFSCSCEQHCVVFWENCALVLQHKGFWYSSRAKKELLSLVWPSFVSLQLFAAFNHNFVYSYSWSSCLHESNPFKQKNEPNRDGIKTKASFCLEEINTCFCIIHLRETTSHRLHFHISLMDHIQNWTFNWWRICTHCMLLLILKVLAWVTQQVWCFS